MHLVKLSVGIVLIFHGAYSQVQELQEFMKIYQECEKKKKKSKQASVDWC